MKNYRAFWTTENTDCFSVWPQTVGLNSAWATGCTCRESNHVFQLAWARPTVTCCSVWLLIVHFPLKSVPLNLSCYMVTTLTLKSSCSPTCCFDRYPLRLNSVPETPHYTWGARIQCLSITMFVIAVSGLVSSNCGKLYSFKVITLATFSVEPRGISYSHSNVIQLQLLFPKPYPMALPKTSHNSVFPSALRHRICFLHPWTYLSSVSGWAKAHNT